MSTLTANVVQFTQDMPVTNASCCSDSQVMCPRCAAAALAARNGAGLTVNPDYDWRDCPTEPVTNARPVKPVKPVTELLVANGAGGFYTYTDLDVVPDPIANCYAAPTSAKPTKEVAANRGSDDWSNW